MYDRTTVQGATFNMRGQLYRGHANAAALFSSPVVSALGSKSDDPGSSPDRGVVPLRRTGNKKRALLLGLAKSIYYFLFLISAVSQNRSPQLVSAKFSMKMRTSSHCKFPIQVFDVDRWIIYFYLFIYFFVCTLR